jgi:hypothetical protein
MEKLGFTKESSWESEEQEKKFLWDKIQQLKEKAAKNARMQAEYERRKKAEQAVSFAELFPYFLEKSRTIIT